jgi:hypothetical protein
LSQVLAQHSTRIAVVATAMLAALGAYAGVVYLVPATPAVAGAQGATLLAVLALAAALNLLTLRPVYRAMLAGPLRVYAAGRALPPLLGAHLTAVLVMLARVEAVGLLGLVLYLVTGRRDWFWAFAGAAAAVMLLAWPTAARTRDHLGLSVADLP